MLHQPATFLSPRYHLQYFSFLLWFSLLTCFITSSDCGCSIGNEISLNLLNCFSKKRKTSLQKKEKLKKVLQRQVFATSQRESERRKGQSEHPEMSEKKTFWSRGGWLWLGKQHKMTFGLFSHWTLRLDLKNSKTAGGEDCYLISRRRKLLPYSSWWRLILFFRVFVLLKFLLFFFPPFWGFLAQTF